MSTTTSGSGVETATASSALTAAPGRLGLGALVTYALPAAGMGFM